MTEPGPPSGDVPPPPPQMPPPAPPMAPPPPQEYGVPAPYGGAPLPPGTYFDPASQVVLPQGLQLASPGRRIGAWFLAFPLAVVTLGIGYVIWGLVIWSRGQTPALQVLGMRCWRPDDAKVPGFWYMALREIPGRIVDGILSIITGIVSFVLFLSRTDHRSLHDLVAGTVVVYDPQKLLGPR
ncbi:MAG TPA: RDD family protein [Amycolatopsis sp.]|nr:RDD family protein [Amycolatopsis sp.]